MKIKNKQLEWYVLRHNWNTKKIEPYNIFYNGFVEDLHTRIVKKKEITNYNELKERIKRWAMYNYWSKVECEMSVGDYPLRDITDVQRIDMYYQVEINLDRITEYVIRELDIKF